MNILHDGGVARYTFTWKHNSKGAVHFLMQTVIICNLVLKKEGPSGHGEKT